MMNRQAAARCRLRQEEKTNGLQEHARELVTTQTYLKDSAALPKATLLDLKSDCLKHAECDCNNIRQYLVQSVDRIVSYVSPQDSGNQTSASVSVQMGLPTPCLSKPCGEAGQRQGDGWVGARLYCDGDGICALNRERPPFFWGHIHDQRRRTVGFRPS